MSNDAQDMIADAIVDTDLLGETIGYQAAGTSTWVDVRACVVRDSTEPTDGDVGALELRPEIYVRRSDLPSVEPGKDRVRFTWRGELREFVFDRMPTEDEGVWHLQVVA